MKDIRRTITLMGGIAVILLFMVSFLPVAIVIGVPVSLEDSLRDTHSLSTEIQVPDTQQSQEQVYVSQYEIQSLSAHSVEHDPIYIDGNPSFSATAEAENWPGDGTPSNPFVIDGLTITGPSGTHLIEIRNTNVSFRIINCFLSGGLFGLYLYKVINGHISNSTVFNNIHGIEIDFHSWNNTVSSNTVFDNYKAGILLGLSRNNTVSSNTVSDNSGDGIHLDWSGDNIISNNIVSNNGGDGIYLYSSENIPISNNTVSNNAYGINFLDSGNSIISGNNISHNDGLGIYFLSFEALSSENMVKRNDFIWNSPGLGFQAIDDGSDNIFAYNYWSDWTSPDTDGNGIVDKPYSIAGNANNQDPYPLTFSSLPHQLSTPKTAEPTRTGTIPVVSPGMTGFMVVLSILSIIILKKVKRKPK